MREDIKTAVQSIVLIECPGKDILGLVSSNIKRKASKIVYKNKWWRYKDYRLKEETPGFT
jgi:hypothetical protein